MSKAYLAKIKATTAKSMAQSILSTRAGKKISDTKFKTMIKKDKNLKKFAYLGKKSSMTKHQAKKFFDTVIESSEGHEQIKINKIAAKKLGLCINKQGKASTIGINKLYESATKNELAAQKDPGPSKQELARQERREAGIKKLHQQDRANETRKEELKEKAMKEKGSNATEKSKSSSAPIRQAGSSGASFSQTSATTPSLNDNVSQTKQKITTTMKLSKIFIPPLNNLSTHIDSIAPIAKKIEISIKHIFLYLKSFSIISDEVSAKATLGLGFNKIPNPANEEIIKKISIETGAQLFVYGTIQKKGQLLIIKIDIINSQTDQKINLARLEQNTIDYFELEKKLTWQINNSLINENSDITNDITNESKAIDLPI